MKNCNKCHLYKSITMFNEGYNACKDCRKEQKRIYREKNRVRLAEQARAYYHDNIDKVNNYKKKNKEKISEFNKNYGKIYRLNNKEKLNSYYSNNRDNVLHQRKKNRLKNIEIHRRRDNDAAKLRRANDPVYKLRTYVSTSINKFLKQHGFSKVGQSFLQIIDWPPIQLKEHLEKQFEPWMNWSNRGLYNIETWNDNDQNTWTWQLDHIIPHSTFQYTSMDSQEFRECWALSNLRPLSAKQNLIDGVNRTRH